MSTNKSAAALASICGSFAEQFGMGHSAVAVAFAGTTSEEAAVTVNGQPALTTATGQQFEKLATLAAGNNTVNITATDPSGNVKSQNYQIAVGTGTAQAFSYDANGNLLTDGVKTYAWDAENRLIKITQGTQVTDIEYDGLHRWTRVHDKNGSTTVNDRRFIWHRTQLVEQRNGTATTAVQRYFAEGVQQSTNHFFYTRDHLGSIREVTNTTGTVVARYDYDPYGRRTQLTGTFTSDFGFTGHYHHGASALNFAPYRMYSAELGRWLSRDPIENISGQRAETLPEGPNLYTYVANDPIRFVDPLGKHLMDVVEAIADNITGGVTSLGQTALQLVYLIPCLKARAALMECRKISASDPCHDCSKEEADIDKYCNPSNAVNSAASERPWSEQ